MLRLSNAKYFKFVRPFSANKCLGQLVFEEIPVCFKLPLMLFVETIHSPSLQSFKASVSFRMEMDPSGIRAVVDSTEKHKLKLDAVGAITEVHNSDGDSLTEGGNSDNEANEEEEPPPGDEPTNQKSVHIIFLRGDSENVSNVDGVNTSIQIEGTAVNCDASGKSLIQLSPVKVSVSNGLGGTTLCPSKNTDVRSDESGMCLEKNAIGEVEDDFDVSGGMLLQADQQPSRDNSRKKKKKKFFKVCKACGELVERQDLISHIKEHRRRKLELVSNPQHKKIIPSVVSVNPLSVEEANPTKSDVPVIDSSIGNTDSVPKSGMSTLLPDRPFKCSVCSETFRTQSSLTIHFKSHSGDCSNSCPVS